MTNISALNLGGGMSFDTDAGALTWINLPLDTTPSTGTVESYSASIGDQPLLTMYGEANSSTGTGQNLRVGIGSTTPWAKLSVNGTTTSATSYAFAVADVASTTRFVIEDAGNVGLGTTTPYALLSVQGLAGGTTALFAVGTSTATGTSSAFQIDQNGILTMNTPGATSTIYGNLYIDGTLRGSKTYTGDLFFKNNFSMAEAPDGTSLIGPDKSPM